VQNLVPVVPLSVGDRLLDIRDAALVRSAIHSIRPEAVIHLAAQSFVPRSFADPLETFHINFLGTYNLLTALKTCGFRGRFLYVGTGDIYGAVESSLLPITENYLPKPRNPYAVSKLAAEALCFQWSQTENLDIVMVRPFNHIGPGQDPDFVVSGLAKQVAEVRRGLRPPIIELGELDVTRDFTDVRDVVAAYKLLLDRGRRGEIYNICSGAETSIRSVLQMLVTLAGVQVEAKSDPKRVRPTEQRRICGSFQKLNTEVGWKPIHTIEESLKDMLEYWDSQTV
jgi:GDP-4-dehydro-6-deoxy-D-mannose reductase